MSDERRRPLVLVADDDDDILELVSYILSGEGYDVVVAHDGAEALELARQARPSLAVLDVSMPNLDGLEVTRRLRADAELASLPVILLTARVADEDAARGHAAGATDYIRKPFKPQELRDRVRDALARLNSP